MLDKQIIGALKQVEAGRTVKEVARELGVSEESQKYKDAIQKDVQRLCASAPTGRPHSWLAKPCRREWTGN